MGGSPRKKRPRPCSIDIESVCRIMKCRSPIAGGKIVKERCFEVLDSNSATAFMTLVTFYVLYSNDILLLCFDKSADDVFVAISSVSFFLFLVEILIQCWCKEDYLKLPTINGLQNAWDDAMLAPKFADRIKIVLSACHVGSFYFWLDTISTFSMVFEIPWLLPSSMGPAAGSSNVDSARAGKASRAGAKAARLVKVVRMIRLIRLVKLYKYFSNKKRKEGTIVPADDETDIPPESRLGSEMSDRTTKRVIVGILFMLIVIPLLQANEYEYSDQLQLQMIFDRRVSLADTESNVESRVSNWRFSEDYFLNNTSCVFLEYEGFNDGQHNIGIIPTSRSSRDSLRVIEKTAITIFDADQSKSLAAEFDLSEKADEEALSSILLTSFVIILLAVGTMAFSHDVNNLVIIPIERMVQLVKEISVNPLGGNHSLDAADIKRMDDGMETTLLLKTISKIAGLMRVGFGEAGAEIIAKNLNISNEDGSGKSLSLLGKGNKIHSIFVFCDVRNFTDTTECLQEEVMLFVNRIAYILHGIVVQYDGAANKNIGDAFLLTWKVDPLCLHSCEALNYYGDKAVLSLVKTMILMRRHEEFLCNFSSRSLSALYERMPRYKCKMGCGLHFGWAIEGAIGSDKKIDASYISPHVNWSEFLESSTKAYGVPLLMSEPFFELLSPVLKKHCRQVDNIRKGETEEVTGLYTFDANFDVVDVKRAKKNFDVVTDSQQNISQHVRLDEASNLSSSNRISNRKTLHKRRTQFSKVNKGVTQRKHPSLARPAASSLLGEAPDVSMPFFMVDVWDVDPEIRELRKYAITDTQRKVWNRGFDAYVKGDWSLALVCFNDINDTTSGGDGPAQFLLSKMEEHNFVVPPDWKGFRDV
mmetsp:Transcript_30364/g.44687  ORF Transcript_30364/g.44687 Transcript_30364/m.44687 type:complete len:871 (-) Transcript_30364:458-3070(-)